MFDSPVLSLTFSSPVVGASFNVEITLSTSWIQANTGTEQDIMAHISFLSHFFGLLPQDGTAHVRWRYFIYNHYYVPKHSTKGRSDDTKTKMKQLLATTIQAHSDATKKTSGAPKNDETRDTATRRHGTDSTRTTDNFSKRRSVSKATKSEYRFCPRSDAIREQLKDSFLK